MDKTSKPTQSKSVGIIMTLVLLCALFSAVVLAYFQLVTQGQQPTNNVGNVTLGGEILPKNNVVVPFNYKVVSVDSTLIVINGERGDMELPFDDDQVTVYRVSDNQKVTLSDIQVGQTVSLAVVPGEKAWVGIE